MILRALNSECLNSQQHKLIEAIQSMFKPNWCCQEDNCYDKVMDEIVRSLILQRQSMEEYTGCWRINFSLEHTISNWYEPLMDKNGIMVSVEVDKALRLQILHAFYDLDAFNIRDGMKLFKYIMYESFFFENEAFN